MGRTHRDLIRNVKTRQHLGGALHNRPVVGASHDNAYYRLYHVCRSSSYTSFMRENMTCSLGALGIQSVASSGAKRESQYAASVLMRYNRHATSNVRRGHTYRGRGKKSRATSPG